MDRDAILHVLKKMDWMRGERIWPNGLRYLWTDAFGLLLLVSLYAEFGDGKFLDQALYRLWLLRCARIWWLRHPDKSLGKEAAMQALGLNTGLQPASTGKPPQPKA